MTIACIDVCYRESETAPTTALAACVVINNWTDPVPASEHTASINDVPNYQSGQFYRRELPCVKAVLAELPTPPLCIVVDGYVWLDDESHLGLGAHLFRWLDQTTPIIGVAKNPYKHSNFAVQVFRGTSIRPLYVTSVGVPIDEAVNNIATLHGQHRFPTVLKRADQLSRGST